MAMSKDMLHFDNVAATLSMLFLVLDNWSPMPLSHRWVTDPGTISGLKLRRNDVLWHAGHLPYAVSYRASHSEPQWQMHADLALPYRGMSESYDSTVAATPGYTHVSELEYERPVLISEHNRDVINLTNSGSSCCKSIPNVAIDVIES